MGFISIIIVENNQLDAIESDPAFGAKIAEAIGKGLRNGPVSIDAEVPACAEMERGAKMVCNAAKVVAVEHADTLFEMRFHGGDAEFVSDLNTGSGSSRVISRGRKEEERNTRGLHPSHKTRYSDASTFDEICMICNNTDQVPGGWGRLVDPCPGSRDACPSCGEKRLINHFGDVTCDACGHKYSKKK